MDNNSSMIEPILMILLSKLRADFWLSNDIKFYLNWFRIDEIIAKKPLNMTFIMDLVKFSLFF
jgi:hypothetical protein